MVLPAECKPDHSDVALLEDCIGEKHVRDAKGTQEEGELDSRIG